MPEGICEDCGIERWKLHRHHIKPKSQGGADEGPNVVRICANCHEDRHRAGGDSEPWRLAHTPEANAKRAASMRLRWADPGYRERVMAARAAGYADPEVQAKKGAAVRRAIAAKTPEERADWARRISATKTGRTRKNGRWSMAWDACRGCGTTSRRHAGDGYCTLCHTRLKRGQPLGEPLLIAPGRTRWAREWDACRGCGSTDREHAGHGLCESCRSSVRSGQLVLE